MSKRSRAPDAPRTESAAVMAARTRARRRLIGAVVLLAVGIVAFPMLFETQPRPIAGDIPFQVSQRDAEAQPSGSRMATLPVTTEPAVADSASATSATGPFSPPANPNPNPTPEPGQTQAAAATALGDGPAVKPKPAPAEPAVAPPAAPAQVQPPPPKQTATPRNEDGARALALLQGAATPPVQIAGRHVVQVGAYAEAAALRDVRAKVEKLGLKTYTQVVDSQGSRRTRVRVGPFSGRDEADAAAAKLRAAGLPAAVLTL